jgi:hypothetical protein
MVDLEKFSVDANNIYLTLEEILVKKQLDYGPGNINNAPGGALNGLLVRMNDKMERLKHLIYHADGEPQNESIDDSFLDIANYAVIAMMVRQGSWPANINGSINV